MPGLAGVESIAYALLVLAVSVFCLTSLDTATRLGRYMFQELGTRHHAGEIRTRGEPLRLRGGPYPIRDPRPNRFLSGLLLPEDGAQHTLFAAPLIEEAGGTPELIRAIQSHTSDFNPELPRPELQMEKILFATDSTQLRKYCEAARRSRGDHLFFIIRAVERKSTIFSAMLLLCDEGVFAKQPISSFQQHGEQFMVFDGRVYNGRRCEGNTLKSITLLLGRITMAAPMSPVSSSVANRIFSICSSKIRDERRRL